VERDVVELLTAVSRAEADRDDPCIDPASVELADLADGEVLGPARAGGQALSR
jgi:hypothetical protein